MRTSSTIPLALLIFVDPALLTGSVLVITSSVHSSTYSSLRNFKVIVVAKLDPRPGSVVIVAF